MPPPISIASAIFIRFSTTSILSLTCAPPRIATNGRAGLLTAFPRYASSFSISNPAADSWTNLVIPTTEACARCAEPNASQTNSPSQRAASCFEKASSFFSSCGWKRTFSKTKTSPSTSALLCDSTPGPTQSNANATGRPSNSSNFFAAGCTEYFGSGPLLGRPRCEAKTNLPPFSIASFSVGIVSRMRVSSVTTPSFSGTLTSTRIKTRLPRKSRSLIVSLSIYAPVQNIAILRVGRNTLRSFSARRKHSQSKSATHVSSAAPYSLVTIRYLLRLKLRRQQHDQIATPARVAPLIVVPGENFHALVANHLGVFGIHDRRIRITLEVRRHQLLFSVGQNPLQRSVGSSLQRCVHRLLRRGLLHEHSQIDHAHVRRRHPHRVTVQLAFQVRQHQVQRLGGSSRAWNHVYCRSARAPQILVRQIEQLLVVGIRVNGSHRAAVDSECLVKHFCHRRQAIGGARCIRNYMVFCRIIGVVIYAEHKCGVRAIRRRGYNHLLNRTAQVRLRLFALGK